MKLAARQRLPRAAHGAAELDRPARGSQGAQHTPKCANTRFRVGSASIVESRRQLLQRCFTACSVLLAESWIITAG